MLDIGEDIVLLAIKRNGTIAAYETLRFALAGSELVRLAQAGRISIDHNGYVAVLDTMPTGNALSDMALAALDGAARKPPRAKDWVARQPGGLTLVFLRSLAELGTVRARDHKAFGLFHELRWVVVDTARVLDAKRRLDAIAFSAEPITAEQAAFAGLVHVAGLGAQLYPRRKGRAARDRLAAIARQDGTVTLIADGTPARGGSYYDDETGAAYQAALRSAVRSSVGAAHHASAQHQGGHGGGTHHGGGGHGGGHGGGDGGGGHHG